MMNNPPVIMIVDDTPENIMVLAETLSSEYEIIIATEGEEALELVKKSPRPDLILLDIMMPGMDGYEVCSRLKQDPATMDIPVIFSTAMTEEEDETKGLELGAVDYVRKPLSFPVVKKRIANHIQLKIYRDHLEELVEAQTVEIREEKNRILHLLESFVVILSDAIEANDQYTGGHVERVANYGKEIALKMNLPEDKIQMVYLGGIIHDIGKIGIPDKILNKPGKLDDNEFDKIKEHPEIGNRLLKRIEELEIERSIVLGHHEKWNGTGYPDRLKGEQIPVAARIISIADVWDALTSDRPYRKSLPVDKAVGIMHQERGESFDPAILDIFMNESDKMYLHYVNRETS